MSLATFILSLVFIVNFALLIYVLCQPKSERRWPIFTMVSLILLWQLTEFLNITVFARDQFTLVLGVQSGLLPTLYLAPAFLWLVFSLFDKWQRIKTSKKILIWLPAVAMSPFVFTSYNASNIYIDQGQVFYDAGSIYWFFAVYFSALMTYGFYILIKNRKHSERIVKRQIDYIFTGTLLAAFGGLIFSILLPLFGVNSLYYFGANSIIFFTYFAVQGLFRYRFHELAASFYRALADLLGLFATGFVFFLFYWTLHDVIFIDFSKGKNLFCLLVFLGLTGPLLFRFIHRLAGFVVTDPTRYLRNIEDNIADILRSSRDLDILFSRLARQINRVIDYREIFIYLAKRKNPDVFYQVFPVGERQLDKNASRLLQNMSEKRQLIDLAEIEYFKLDRELHRELLEQRIDIALPIFYNRQLLGVVIIDNGQKVLSVEQLEFLGQVSKYLDIAVGSLLLHQQDMAENIRTKEEDKKLS
ncbi:MAG: histidine kinase N-terminal 7TM domain-containing protein [Patescibacteria group bacterium]|nr:histidine kinase N-terminal 7TM domain-containing protein [Patescibacteria group bacterium]